MGNLFTTEAASKAFKWILGKDSTAVATWITAIAILAASYLFYERVYLPGRNEDRALQRQLAEEHTKAVAEVRAMAEAQGKACDNDKERLFKANEALMNRVDRMLEQQRFGYSSAADAGVVASPVPSEFDCDP
jgi:hypothetical protein